VWKGVWSNHFRNTILVTLPLKSPIGRENGEGGMMQPRAIALEIVVFGPQYVGEIITKLNSSVRRDGQTNRWMISLTLGVFAVI
jgi:hypothetical protein